MEQNMTRHALLYEQYESSVFSLILDEIMKREGELLLTENEQMKEDSNTEPSSLLDKRCMKALKRKQAHDIGVKAFRKMKQMMAPVSVVFFVIFIIFLVPFCTVSAFRVSSLNLVANTFDKGTVITANKRHMNNEHNEPNNISKYPTWFPEGEWKLVYLCDEPTLFLTRYEDQSSNTVFYSEIPVEGSSLTVDTENAEIIKDVRVHDSDAMMSVKDGLIILVWIDDVQSVICNLEISGSYDILSPETALRIAESIILPSG